MPFLTPKVTLNRLLKSVNQRDSAAEEQLSFTSRSANSPNLEPTKLFCGAGGLGAIGRLAALFFVLRLLGHRGTRVGSSVLSKSGSSGQERKPERGGHDFLHSLYISL